MDRSDHESTSTSEETSPIPPPYPVFASISHHQKCVVKRGAPYRGHCCVHTTTENSWDRLFDEGYKADVLINTDHGGVLYAHANILGVASPVLRNMLNQSRTRSHRRGRRLSISIGGVPPEAVHVFTRFLYSSCYEEKKLEEYAPQLLILSHVYAVPQLKRVCEQRLEGGLINSENAIDIFQLALLCDSPRLSLICHRFIMRNFKAVSATDGWKAMKESHPFLEKEIMGSVIYEDNMQKERMRKLSERKVYEELYEAMEALVHICRDGCRTIGPHDKVLKEDHETCNYEACKQLESLLRHFGKCQKRVPGGCIHCKRMWQLLELHSRLCANSDVCRVPLCRKFKHRTQKQNKKEVIKWRILVKKIVRSKSVSGAPFFSLESR